MGSSRRRAASPSPARTGNRGSEAEKRPGVLTAVLILLSLQAVTLLAALEAMPSLKASPIAVAAIGVVSLAVVGAGALRAFRACGCQFSLAAVFFAVTGWSAAIDLVLALSLLGLTRLGKFYVVNGEEYFKSSWGCFALLWDGTAHYAAQLFLAHATLLGRPCRRVGLAWAGSIINSMPVLLLGGATGHYSADIKPSTGLNAPYVLVPIAYLVTILDEDHTTMKPARPAAAKATTRAVMTANAKPASVSHRYVSAAWALGHILAVLVHAWRAVVVLGSRAPLALWWIAQVEPILGDSSRPSFGFIRVQCLVFFFYYVPYHAWATHSLLTTKPSDAKRRQTLATWSMVVAGGYAQAQVCCGSAAFLKWTGFEPLQMVARTPAAGLALNLALAALPAAFAATR